VLEYRHGDDCDDCESFLGTLQLWSKREIAGEKYFGLPSGCPNKVAERLDFKFSWPKVRDKRPQIPFTSKLKFTGKLYDGTPDDEGNPRADQVTIIDDWFKAAEENNVGGLIKSPTRSGKTIIGVNVICRMRQKAFITGRQIDWLRQFCMAFAAVTNIKQIVAKRGIDNSPVVLVDPKGWPEGKLYGVKVVKSWNKKIGDADVVIGCYQAFIHKRTGLKRLREYIKGKYSVAVVDECDQIAAPGFSRVLNRSPFYRKVGLTATTTRTDGMEWVTEDIMGEVVSVGKITSLTPTLTLWETGIKVKPYKQWFALEAFLTTHKERNVQIVRQVFSDLRDNDNNSILIATNRVDHVRTLVAMINHQARVQRSKGEKWAPQLAVEFRGNSNRDFVLTSAKRGTIRVVVGMMKMCQRGLDVPSWTHVYVGVCPMSSAPNFNQLANRVCTPKTGKKKPIVRIMLDDHKIGLGCIRKLVYPSAAKEFGIARGLKSEPPLYKIDDDQRRRLRDIINHPKSYSFKEAPSITKLGKSRSERDFQKRVRKKNSKVKF